ncbi:MAG: 16S rRNA (guanine(527)-N(7))-methyltransferase RsmG [Phycisphaeraceae bacterium]|nr:16S rRNA (guanine(527)-N(7))-methyltransferase RsmG [Phycisphaeraceae bacterium]
MSLKPTDEFDSACRAQGVEFDAGEVERLGAFLSFLLETNERFNLTAVTDPAAAWMRHIFDSLTLFPPLSEVLDEGARVIDVGSGGGLPGIPLAIVMPSVHFTLLEATGKKAAFLREAAAKLGLANVTVLEARSEKAGQDPAHRERYDAATARAVGPMSVIAELTVPLVKIGGRVFLIKGQKAEEELAAARKALHLLHARHETTLDTPTGKIVVLDKQRKTPAAYPRRDGEPKKAPL